MPRRPSRLLRSFALIAVALLTFAACGSDGDGASAGASADASGSSVLQFTAKTLDGRTVDGTTYRGRPVAFWFWAPT